MARGRAKTRAKATATGTTNNNEGVKRMAGLTAEQIQALLGKTRQKGVYVQRLNEFLASGEMGVSVKDTWVEFRDKKDTTLKQGFDNARENKEAGEGSENIKVISNDGDVFLVNLALAGAELEAAAA